MARNKQKLFSYVEIDDSTPIQKLKVTDQLRALFKNAVDDDAQELKAEDAATIYELQLKANLFEFLAKSTSPIKQGRHNSVTLNISSKFEPVLDEVLNDRRIANFYNVRVLRPNIDYDIDYMVEVKLEVKDK